MPNSYYLLDPRSTREEAPECSLTKCGQPDHVDAKRCESCNLEKCPQCTFPMKIEGMIFCMRCSFKALADAACPYCGEVGGSPIEIESSEYQGQSPHGGIVTWTDTACTLCKGRPGPREIASERFEAEMDDERCPF